MLTVLSCLAYDHDYRFVAAAAFVCVLGSWITIRLFQSAREAHGGRRRGWLFLTGVAAGSTIWTTHFLAMLGFLPDLPKAYVAAPTVLSLFIAVGGCMLGTWVSALPGRTSTIELGGVIIGLAIVAMHYTGMSACTIPGRISWDPALVGASVVLSMLFSGLALHLAARREGRLWSCAAAAVFTLAICSLHFTAMGAVVVSLDPTVSVPDRGLSDDLLGLAVMGVMSLVIGTGFSTYYIDRSSRSEAIARYRYLALHDPLTGLPNRAFKSDHLTRLIAESRAGGQQIAVVALDLNRFKEVNDVYGHAAGDDLLRELSRRFRATLHAGEFIARVGGDEFVAIKPGVESRDVAAEFVRRLLAEALKPVAHGERVLAIGLSAGVALFPEDADSAEDLVTRADLALYRAKRSGIENMCFFERSMDELARRRSKLALDLKQAVTNGEFILHYQPQHAVASGDLIGFEALIRWRRQDELVPPSEFIPVAEESGSIIEIGEWVLRTACSEAAMWDRSLGIAVNVSPRQISQSDIVSVVHSVLLETGLRPSLLELEITESTLIDDFAHTLHVLRQLKALGVRIAIDDFGTGYSSLSTLQAFPFDKIKIDRSFTERTDTNHQAASIVRAVVGLGRSLDIPVLAEGVETDAHLTFLKSEHCDEAQGFYFARPAELADIRHLVYEDAGARHRESTRVVA